MRVGAQLLTPEKGLPERSQASQQYYQAFEHGHLAGRGYRLLGCLPAGSCSGLVLAEVAGGTSVVLKTGPAALIAHERRLLERLDHPGIVRLASSFSMGSTPVLALEYLGGGDLVSLAGADPIHWLDAAQSLAATLTWLHEQGIVHRDLKSRHVMFDEAGQVRLIDFGSAAAIGSAWTAAGTTHESVDPARSGPVSVADDVYGFAVILHELLHGCLPGTGRSSARGHELESMLAAVLAPRSTRTRPGLAELRSGIELLQRRTREQ